MTKVLSLVRTLVTLSFILISFSVSGIAQPSSKHADVSKKITMRVTQSMGVSTGTLVIDANGFIYYYDPDSRHSKGSMISISYKDIEYCSFVDNRKGDYVIVGGRQRAKEGLGSSLWIRIQRKKESSIWGFVVDPGNIDQFFKAAETFGKRCK